MSFVVLDCTGHFTFDQTEFPNKNKHDFKTNLIISCKHLRKYFKAHLNMSYTVWNKVYEWCVILIVYIRTLQDNLSTSNQKLNLKDQYLFTYSCMPDPKARVWDYSIQSHASIAEDV